MLLERAFGYLPELLTRSNYELQEQEAGLVNAMSLAALQELNARNIPNPIATIVVEKGYTTQPFLTHGYGRPRYLRSDLFLDTTTVKVSTPELYKFGWRDLNYLEAKFFRDGPQEEKEDKKNDEAGGDPNTNASLLLIDLIRLCCLVPPEVRGWSAYYRKYTAQGRKGAQEMWVPYEGEASPNLTYGLLDVGRYLLHVYHGLPENFVGTRAWLPILRKAGGNNTVHIRISDDPDSTFKKYVGREVGDLDISVTVTNQVIEQIDEDGSISYTCVLTRIDNFSVTLGGKTWTEDGTGYGTESAAGAWVAIRDKIGQSLGVKKEATTGQSEPEPTKEPVGLFGYSVDTQPFNTYELTGFTGATGSFYAPPDPFAPKKKDKKK